ncbi:hypothetical protein IX317_000641 [Fusobacterium sp. DD29]|uniref:phage tail sheath protein n=1 Tax=unclassified Fusobacterium TaxID=2648384 RepID=UPI001B8CF255|nr:MULTISPECIES: phage tail sheath protein [unclassified Fusobacterium]MBR8700237.1 hypothetical protein [Fusobacterium sp. DD45]MBR8710508.1 hypothetical protein [Fusobacterium sp. DD28]MBR8748980.1 hypothetical protein [Fusobacterium sp. DD29]MBR8751042.1 hypothetical protein [Fusobacterium sp. DD26]MBR8761286.1 hypothetical protein [Fusobacterium sp. DD25]
MYKHGTYQVEGATPLQLPVVLDYGHFIVGMAPINQVKKENRKINDVVRVGTYKEALEYFGNTHDMDFSISQAIKCFFELYAVAPLYIVNILDPEKHKGEKKTLSAQNLVRGKIVIPSQKVIPETVVVQKTSGKQTVSDVQMQFTSEGLELSVKLDEQGTVDIEYYEVDLSKVKKSDAIGGYDADSMKRTGLELVNEVFLKYSELPAFIDIPDFSGESDVAAIMETKAKTLNGGMFESMALINADITKKYDELSEWKDTNNIIGNDQIILYGGIKLAGEVYHQSIHYAALSLKVDGENNGVPSQGPSNYSYKMDAFVWKKGKEYEEVRLDKEQQANFLNKNGVVTAINFKGWRCWGSETAKNPLATDPKDKYIYGRRMFKYIGNELVLSYFNNVDKKFTLKLAETMEKSMNLRLNALVASDNLLSGKVAFYADDNSLIDIINGDITWTIQLGIIPGAKSITFKKVYDVEALMAFANSLAA